MTPHEQQAEKELNEAKAAIQLMEHGKYGRVHLSEQIRELTSCLEASKRANSEMREVLKPIMFFLQDYLRTTTHPGVSRLLGNAHDALESSTSGQSYIPREKNPHMPKCPHGVDSHLRCIECEPPTAQSYIPRETLKVDNDFRDKLGRRVREVWIQWAQKQPNLKPSWLIPYDKLTEPNKEVDRLIGCSIWGDCMTALRKDIPRAVAEKMYEALNESKISILDLVKYFNTLDTTRNALEGNMVILEEALQLAQTYGLGKDKLNENS